MNHNADIILIVHCDNVIYNKVVQPTYAPGSATSTIHLFVLLLFSIPLILTRIYLLLIAKKQLGFELI